MSVSQQLPSTGKTTVRPASVLGPSPQHSTSLAHVVCTPFVCPQNPTIPRLRFRMRRLISLIASKINQTHVVNASFFSVCLGVTPSQLQTQGIAPCTSYHPFILGRRPSFNLPFPTPRANDGTHPPRIRPAQKDDLQLSAQRHPYTLFLALLPLL